MWTDRRLGESVLDQRPRLNYIAFAVERFDKRPPLVGRQSVKLVDKPLEIHGFHRRLPSSTFRSSVPGTHIGEHHSRRYSGFAPGIEARRAETGRLRAREPGRRRRGAKPQPGHNQRPDGFTERGREQSLGAVHRAARRRRPHRSRTQQQPPARSFLRDDMREIGLAIAEADAGQFAADAVLHRPWD